MSHPITRAAASAIVAASLAGAVNAAKPPVPAPISWVDLQGARYTAAAPTGLPTVLLFGSTRCPCADGYTGRIRQLASDYASVARLFLVFSNPGVARPEVEKYAVSRGFSIPVIHDVGGRLARSYRAVATPTAVVLDGAGRVRYRGAIDDNPEPVAVRHRYLREALDRVAAGRPVVLTQTRAIGCTVGGEKAAPKPVKLVEGIGKAQWKVTTNSAQAQRFFNQGLNRWFGFNFPEAERSFREAARLDPNCAMAYWGITLSMGMTYNFDFDPTRLPEAVASIRKAQTAASRATPKEQAMIAALAVRHPAGAAPEDQKLTEYHTAMATVYAAYPEDPHVGVFYAASGMDLHPWALWKKSGEPQEGTLEIIRTLEDVLRRDPNHIGAHHFYIHATEASPEPQKAVRSAQRLAELAPQSGHLVHMPAHTWVRIGNYLNSASSNNRAASIDRAYFAAEGGSTPYAGYYVHNLDFLIAAYEMDGRAADALETAGEMAKVVASLIPQEAPLWCGTASSVMSVYTRFGRWDDILKAPPADEKNPFTSAWYRYGRTLAFAAKGDVARAEAELALLEPASRTAEESVPPIPVPGFADGLKGAYRLTRIVAAGKVALAKGDGESAVRLFREGMAVEDALPYIEPATWRYPVREALGGALLKLGRAPEAERAFRENLKANPKNGRALFGLMIALDRQGKADQAAAVQAEFREAWKRADTTLSAEAL